MYSDIDENKLMRYVDNCISGMESDLFTYLAHPDLFMIAYDVWDDNTQIAATKICQRSKELNIPLEINCEGIRKEVKSYANGTVERCSYPVKDFWQVTKQIQCPVIIGVDAHKPADLNSDSIKESLKWVNELELNVVKDNKIENIAYNALKK